MRHRIFGRKLNRSAKHRKALFKNLAASLINHGEITTTQTKAKTIQAVIDKLITRAKKNNLYSRRAIHAFFNQKNTTSMLVDKIAPQLDSRNSGYTKITKIGRRRGDNALMAKIQFTDKIVYTDSTKPEKPIPTTKSNSKTPNQPTIQT